MNYGKGSQGHPALHHGEGGEGTLSSGTRAVRVPFRKSDASFRFVTMVALMIRALGKRLPLAVDAGGGSAAGNMVRWHAAAAGLACRIASDCRQPRWQSLEHGRARVPTAWARPRGFLGSRQASQARAQPASRASVPDSLAFERPTAGPVELGEPSPRLRRVRETADGLEVHWQHGDDPSFFHYEWLHR